MKSEAEIIQPRQLYVFCHDVDAIHAEIKSKGVESMTSPEDADYKMRDFDLADPDGNQLTFGKALE